MARLQIEPNQDADAMLAGGRTTVHRLTLLVSANEIHELANGKVVKLSEKLPAITVNHLYLDLKLDA